MLYWRKIIKYFNILVLIGGLLVPLVLFLNRFLIPDVSFDSINYHLYLGYKGLNWENNKFEFYQTGIFNFSTILEISGYVLMKLFGYRIGSIGGLMFLYLSIFVVYKIYKLYDYKFNLLDKWWSGLLFVSSFMSFESFLQIATYYADIEVMFLMLSSMYYLFKYEKSNKLVDLIISAFITSIFILGKMTTWYYLPTYFMYLLFVLLSDKKLVIKVKMFRFFLAGFISVLLVIPWLYQNFVLTGNPVFPFYNGIFKSEYYIQTNFTQVIFGGRNLFEKLFWGVVSIKIPVRLGEVHDLFTDYKINIYFISSIFALIWTIIKKNYRFMKLVIFYLGLYLSWSLTFGYLRYGLVLEVLGGLILLIWFIEFTHNFKYIFLLPILFLLIVQGKRIVNISLAYDISFRPGYYFNRQTYFNFFDYLFVKQISIDDSMINRYRPNVYLNCSIPNMTYFVLSKFNNLPVFNIDSRVSDAMVLDREYSITSKERLNKYLNGKETRFVTITTEQGLNNEYLNCVNNLNIKKYKILEEIHVNNFLEYTGQKLVVIFGEKLL